MKNFKPHHISASDYCVTEQFHSCEPGYFVIVSAAKYPPTRIKREPFYSLWVKYYHMPRLLFLCCLAFHAVSYAQTDTSKWLRGFPITDYMVDLNDSVKVVQLSMPDGLKAESDQLGILYGVYNTSREDAVQKGYGRCNLIKGDYYYFGIRNNTSGKEIRAGDLLYILMPKTAVYYGRIPKLAGHYIRLLNVYDEAFYDRFNVFIDWTPAAEKKAVDSMLADIRFTADYFLKNEPSMNIPIKSGDDKGKKVLDVMLVANATDVEDFIDYVLARPRNYAGKEWKVSEVFATWLSEGAPRTVK